MAHFDKIVLVIGDLMLDRYIFGSVDRISPEASCPIFQRKGKYIEQLGGAANVAKQIRSFAQNIYIVGSIANDEVGRNIKRLLTESEIKTELICYDANVSTLKERYITDLNQQILRVDEEDFSPLTLETEKLIISFIENRKDEIDCIILSDYEKGVLTETFCREIIKLAMNLKISTIVDIKTPSINKYWGATYIKGNQKEFSTIFPEAQNIQDAYNQKEILLDIKEKFNACNIVITCGKNGLIAVDSKSDVYNLPAEKKHIYDVTGAGDVVTAYLYWGFSNDMSFYETIYRANLAASESVQHLGNVTIHPRTILRSGKVVSISDFLKMSKGLKTVFTNGCFDVIHAGHIDLIHQAKQLGDILVIGLNSDSSIRRIKGRGRPVNTFEYRSMTLSALIDVDYIIEFEEDTPLELITQIKPDILVKGGDYSIDKIIGADFVASYNGEVRIIPHTFNISTTKILNHEHQR